MAPSVFPAYAGMSPWLCLARLSGKSFPRIRGDEPLPPYISLNFIMFSPHTRG